jgi:hypothetical protein
MIGLSKHVPENPPGYGGAAGLAICPDGFFKSPGKMRKFSRFLYAEIDGML